MKDKKPTLEEAKSTPIKNNLTNLIVAVLIAGTLSFFGGMKYQDYKTSKVRTNFMGQFRQGTTELNGQNRAGTNARLTGGKPVAGEIVSIDDKSITLKMQDDSTRIVILADSTTYSKTETGSKTELKTGIQVGVFGIDNSDGSVTAQNIQLNPEFRMFGQTASPAPIK